MGHGGTSGADDEGEAVVVLVHLVEDVVDGGALDLVFVVRVSEELLAGAELAVLVGRAM